MKRYVEEFDINGIIERRLDMLKGELLRIQREYEKMPEGKLLVAPGTTEKSFRYYLRKSAKEKQGVYLGKNQGELKVELAEKKYQESLMKNISCEINKLEKVLRLGISDSIIDSFSCLNPGVKKLIKPLNIDDDLLVNIWMNENYCGLGFDENDDTDFYSDRNERMRSKSEVLIANSLIKNNIPYKYECPVLVGNGKYLYPDFTVLDIKRRKQKYWEHLGKMSDISYIERNIRKLDDYRNVGIYLGINLFVTYESAYKPLGSNEIKSVIKRWF